MKKKLNYRLFVGLGNPGHQYNSTYHNTGWLALDFLIQNLKSKIGNFPPESSQLLTEKFKKCDLFQYLKIEDRIFIKPQTFINESGKAVVAALKYFSAKNKTIANGKIKFEEILIIHDDSDIELGGMKFSFGCGAAGHHGVESIVGSLKTKDFWRLRIGIRQKTTDEKKQTIREKAGEFVLKKITPTDKLILEQLFESSLTF